MTYKKAPMVNWYDPKQLASTGVKTVVSSVFGNFADRREMQAALDPNPPEFEEGSEHNYSERDEIWIDFISDLGDGFDATYTMAKLMAEDYLEVDGEKIPRGDILVMGGDEVYPTPEMHEYKNRLQDPYHFAFPEVENDPNPPSLYAIPGNHDWYDGLTNFLKIFCQRRKMGNWRTKQRRSYFALKLPHNHWLLAIDIQLSADIDYPQIEYFRYIAEKKIQKGDKVILVTAEPSWVFETFNYKDHSNKRLLFFINKILKGETNEGDPSMNYYGGKNKDIEINTILTGDLHHYARYEDEEFFGYKRHWITSGGGGAFMHPTHTLPKELGKNENKYGKLKAVFPSTTSSRMLSWRNLLFSYYSFSMLFLFTILFSFMGWLLQSGSLSINSNFFQIASGHKIFGGDLGEYLILVGENIFRQPSLVFLNALILLGLLLFTDNKSGKGDLNYIAGFFHGLFHLAGFYLILWLSISLSLKGFGAGLPTTLYVLWFLVLMLVFTTLISGFIFGLYLLISVNHLGNHITEASSSYRWEGYKNFLRIRLNKDGLKIYPIGVKEIVSDWKVEKKPDGKVSVSRSKIDYELIEKPISIP